VRVLDVNVEGETHYLVMQFVRGESAGAFVRRTKEAGQRGLPESEALKIVRAATKGLAAAHERGIIHRDVKPDNILIPGNNCDKAKLADLGLAKPEGGGGSVGTMSMVAMGTPGYMAPEQAEDAKTAGPPADVFAMGATLYALMMGRAPFAGASIAVILRDTAMKEPEPLPDDVSQKTRDIVARCLSKNPAQRFANGAELLSALEGRIAVESVIPTVVTSVRRKPAASRAPLAIGIIAALLVGGGVVAAIALKGKTEPPGPVVDPDAEARKSAAAIASAKEKAAAGDYDGALAALGELKSPEAASLRGDWSRLAAEAKEKRDRETRIAQVLRTVELLETDGDLDAALTAINNALVQYAGDPQLKEAKQRINQKLSAAKSTEQKTEAYRRWMDNADAARFDASSKDTLDAWKRVLDACAKAAENAQTDPEKEAVAKIRAEAGQRRDWLLAREADAKGNLEEAIRLAGMACDAAAPLTKDLADYRAALEVRKRTADERAARKREFDRLAAAANAEKDPVKAADLWKQALATADEAKDAADANTALGTLAPEIAKAEEEKRKAEMKRRAQAAFDEAEAALKAGKFDLAVAKFNDAKEIFPTESAEGVTRVETARRRKAYEDAIAEAREAQAKQEWARLKACCERALAAQPDDAAAQKLLATAEENLIPDRIEIDMGGGLKPVFVRVKPCTMTLGDPNPERDDVFKDAKLHVVTLTRDYWVQTTEVTQAQWQALMGANPSKFKGDTLPVESVSFLDCATFVAKFNAAFAKPLGKRRASLPTEAEWEIACRAGREKSKWSFGDAEAQLGEYAWFKENSKETTHPVATKKANAWGLYDMHGNVYEWCLDWSGDFPATSTDPSGAASGEYKTSHGGCWSYDARFSRAGFRGKPAPTSRLDSLGLRLVIK
jgi:formylglycine-generating enzyme required for sulfatase activity